MPRRLLALRRGKDPRILYVRCPVCRMDIGTDAGVIFSHGRGGEACRAGGWRITVVSPRWLEPEGT